MTTHTVTGTIVREGVTFQLEGATAGPAGATGPAGRDAFLRPVTSPTVPAVEVTQAERVAVDLDFFPDGNMGLMWDAAASRITGTAPNGPVNAGWRVGTDGALLDTVVDAEITTLDIIDPDTNYAAGGGRFYLPGLNQQFSIYHGEEAVDDPPDFTYWSFLGLLSWEEEGPTDCGRIVTPNAVKADPALTRNVEVAGGAGIVHDGYFHVFYRETLTGGATRGMSVARCAVDTLVAALNAGTVPLFWKWTGTDWTQPGLGGVGAELLPDTPGDPKWCDVVWLEASECFMLAYSFLDDDDLWGIGVRFSTDLVNWSAHRTIGTPEAAESLYLTLTAPLTEQSAAFDQRSVPGDEVWLFTTRSVNGETAPGRWADATVHKTVITLRSVETIFAEVDALAAEVDDISSELEAFDPVPEAWTEVSSLSNSWGVLDSGPCRYYKHLGRGYLHLAVVTGGASGTTILTLPAGYRPDSFETFQAWNTSDNTEFSGSAVTVNTDGTVEITYPNGAHPICLGGSFSWRIP